MRRAEMIVCVVFVLLGAHVVQQATLLPYSEKYGPGPGFMPFWLGWAFIAFAVLRESQLHAWKGLSPIPSENQPGTIDNE